MHMLNHFYGFLDLPWWGNIVYALVVTHITIITVTVFLHRCQSHRSLTLHPILSHFFRLWSWLTTGQETKAWAAIHRKHHAKCETIEDPHSPQVLGLKKVLWEGAELYRKEAKNQETLERYGKGTPDDWLERNLYTKYSARGVLVTMVINFILLGPLGLTIWAIQMAWIPFWAAGVVNGVAHFWGYRNFECPDAATNISPWGILIGGEELHNNHHTYPTSAKLSVKWWELDIGWMYIKIFSFLGLAKIKKISPKLNIIEHKNIIDVDTLTSIISNRIHFMTQYTQSVVVPILKQESILHASTLSKTAFNKLRNLISRESSLIDDSEKLFIEESIHHTSKLKDAYLLRQNLQEIWNKTTATKNELIQDLVEWCKKAESTGIKYLKEFVMYIKKYSIQKETL